MGQPDSETAEIWLSRKEAANWLSKHGLQICEGTLRKYASNQNALGGPPFYRFGWGSVRYLLTDLKSWRQKRMQRVE